MAKETEAKTIPKGLHANEHETGGIDEISVAGLLGLLAADQHVLDAEVLAVAAALAHTHLTVAETQVFTGNTPGAAAWTDLNLAATIGSQATLVLLKITGAAVDGFYFAFRKNGDADNFYAAIAYPFGCALFKAVNNVHIVVLVATDAAGIIEWYTNYLAGAITIDVIAYIK